jgi:hypothetical protein
VFGDLDQLTAKAAVNTACINDRSNFISSRIAGDKQTEPTKCNLRHTRKQTHASPCPIRCTKHRSRGNKQREVTGYNSRLKVFRQQLEDTRRLARHQMGTRCSNAVQQTSGRDGNVLTDDATTRAQPKPLNNKRGDTHLCAKPVIPAVTTGPQTGGGTTVELLSEQEMQSASRQLSSAAIRPGESPRVANSFETSSTNPVHAAQRVLRQSFEHQVHQCPTFLELRHLRTRFPARLTARPEAE